ncbi:WD40 repeat domain-containing protein [Embleya hyalina]|uniref:WD40 repeat domain-containing protein n=1 Tax=Embleya hyalina TaxID=516124 RepID=UPI000F82A926|nr:WD40 repeat domain-containing protein [Embleya hyalina]
MQAWDLVGGHPLGPPFEKHTDPVENVATAMLDGRIVAVTGDRSGVVRVWDPVEGREVREPLQVAVHYRNNLVTFTLDGRPSVITDGTNAGLVLHDLDTGEPVRQLLPDSRLGLGPQAVAVAEPAGRPVVIAGGSGACHVLDPATGDPLCDPLPVGKADPGLVTVVDAGIGPVVVATTYAKVWAWDLAAACEGREAVGPRVLPGTLTALSVDESKGVSSIVSEHADHERMAGHRLGTSYLCVTDLAEGTPVRPPVELRGEGATRLDLTRIAGEAVAVVDAAKKPRLLRVSDGTPIATAFTNAPASEGRFPR